MKTIALSLVAWMMLLPVGYGFSPEELSPFEYIFTRCRSRHDTTELDDLRSYARCKGFSDAEMATRLVELAKQGLNSETDAEKQRLASSALIFLKFFGGEAEGVFARQVMRETDVERIRLRAACTAIRLLPEETGELLQELEADKRFGDADRYCVCEEVFHLGQEGDAKIRQNAIEVLNEMRMKDPCRVNQNRLGGWVAELKGGDAWESWLREVVAGEGFYDANREHAFKLAVQTGRNGDAKTRQHVIEVFGELCNDESLDVDRNALRRWIAELEKLP